MLACSCKLYHSFLTDIDRSVTNLKAGRAEAHYLGTSSRSLLSFQSSNRMTYNSKQAAESTASLCAQTDERTFSALMEFGPQPQLYLISEWDKESGSVGRHWSVYSPAIFAVARRQHLLRIPCTSGFLALTGTCTSIRPILCKQCMHNFHIGFILSVHHLPAFLRTNQTFE